MNIWHVRQQFVVTDRYTILQDTKAFDKPSVDQHIRMLSFFS